VGHLIHETEEKNKMEMHFKFMAALNSSTYILENTRTVQWLLYAPLNSAQTVYLLCVALGTNSDINWPRTQFLLHGVTSVFLHTVR